MTTQVGMVNRVLRRLREDTVSSITDTTYSTLIAEFINEAIEECTSAHDWRRYERTCYATIANAANTADVSRTVGNGGAVESGTVLTDRSKLIWTMSSVPTILFTPVAYASALATSNDDWVRLAPSTKQEILIAQRLAGANNSDTYPNVFDLTMSTTDYDAPLLTVWPIVDQASTVLIQHWTPPSTLTLTGTDDATEIEAPEEIIFRYVLMVALNERGEEIGEPGNTAESRYYRALERAIGRFSGKQGRPVIGKMK